MTLLEKEKELTRFTNNYISILTYSNKNINTIQNQPNKEKINIKLLIVSFFISFFIFFVIALIKNYFTNIKNDPIQSEKIHKAWIDGK